MPCTSKEEYQFGQIISAASPSSAQTNSWITITVETKNNGKCTTMYRTYAEIPTNLFPRWSFPDYFWLDPDQSTTVSMQLWTGGLTGTGDIKIILDSHYAVLPIQVASVTKSITITNESPSTEEQLQQTKEAFQKEINEALERATISFQNSPISRLGQAHFALHIVGEQAAVKDAQTARKAQYKEIEITENVGDSITIAVGHAFTPAGGAGQALVQAVCAFSKLSSTPLKDIRNKITQSLLKNDIVSDRYADEEKNSYVTAYIGGPVANRKMVSLNAQMRELKLPYFDGNTLIAPDGRRFGWGYGVFALIPDIHPASLGSDGTFRINIAELNRRMGIGNIRLYHVIAAGTDRVGTVAAGEAYIETLAVAEEMSQIIKRGLCAGDLAENDLYLLTAILSNHARTHVISTLKHPEVLDIGIEFTQSLLLLGNTKDNSIELRPMALIVRASGDTWIPVRIYTGGPRY